MASEGILSGNFFIGAKGRNPNIDFLRALAIVLVLIRHFLDRNPTYEPYIPAFVTSIGLFGWSGVDLFYVLSGFLIFSIIFRQEAQGAFNWITFYLKRALRIWPAYFASLVVCMAVGQFTIRAEDLTYFVFFLQNYVGPLSELNGGVYWSIAVEEHFYLVAPLLLAASAAVRRYRVHILLLLVIIPPILRLIVYETVVQGDMAKFYYKVYFPTHMRFDALAMGVLCAYMVTQHSHLFRRALVRRLLPLVCLSLLVVAAISTEPLNRYSQHPSLAAAVIGFSATPGFWASVLLIGETFRIFDRFGQGPTQVVAYLSYSMYLYHIMVLNSLDEVFRNVAANGLTVVGHAAAFVLATLLAGGTSYLLVERYFLLKKHGLTAVVPLRVSPPGDAKPAEADAKSITTPT